MAVAAGLLGAGIAGAGASKLRNLPKLKKTLHEGLSLLLRPEAGGHGQFLRSFFVMTKSKTTAFLICTALTAIVARDVSATGEGAWRSYSQESNGDVYFFDTSRVERTESLQRVWSRVRYKTSVMGAASYQSLLEIDCSERTERILQNTFFSDRHWQDPAMNTDMTSKPKRQIPKGSATERLSGILCDQ